jgi:Ca2+/Na+ antiporter
VVIGYTFGIPDSVMGTTFLAAGSSVPDAMSSVLVVRQGKMERRRSSIGLRMSPNRSCRYGCIEYIWFECI